MSLPGDAGADADGRLPSVEDDIEMLKRLQRAEDIDGERLGGPWPVRRDRASSIAMPGEICTVP